jgi:hypothetical protein
VAIAWILAHPTSPEPADSDFETAFKVAYKLEFGFLLTSAIVVDDVKASD